MWAAYLGYTPIVKYLLSHGANVDAVDEHGISSLAWAAGRNHIEIVEALLEAGASPNLCDKNNTTPLIWASRRGRILFERTISVHLDFLRHRLYKSGRSSIKIQCQCE